MDRDEPIDTSWDHKKIGTECIGFDQWIELPAGPSDDLDWSKELLRAKQLREEGKKIVWSFRLGLDQPFFPLEDELRFQAIALALKQFSQLVWPLFKTDTLALSLYRGSADFSDAFSWSEKQLANFAAWLEEEELVDTPQARRLFAADAFAIYFQMLSHRLPDEVPVFLLFDIRDIGSPADALQVISKERFEHFLVALRDRGLPLDGFVWDEKGVWSRSVKTSHGIVFPERRSYATSFNDLLKSQSGAKIVFEAFLTEEWEGLDRLFVLKGSMGMQGERKLKGFAATEGEVEFV